MASKSKFISDLRSAVEHFLQSHRRAAELLQVVDSQQWTVDALAAEAGGELSAEDFGAAIAVLRASCDNVNMDEKARCLIKFQQ